MAKVFRTFYVHASLERCNTLWQKFISPINQSTCQSYPSCSRYGKLAIKKHGFHGILLTADRLNRCGHDTHQYTKIIVNQSIKNYDPVP